MTNLGKWRFISFLPCILRLPFIFSGFQLSLLQNSNPKGDGSMGAGRKKFDHIVLGPAAGQGLPNRIQCEGLQAVKRRSLPSFHSSLVNERISFVTVFTIYNQSLQNSLDQKVSTIITVGNSTYDKIGRSMAILNVFANFIKVAMPRSNIFILTDPASNFPVVPSNAVVMHIPGNYSRNNLMLQRIKSYIVIHFKGSRKRLMMESWNFFNSHPVDFADMMCLILKSGRSKYDF